MIEFLISVLIFWYTLKFAKGNPEENKTENKENVKNILIEKIEDQYYAWEKEPKEKFVYQSKVLKDVIEHLALKFQDDEIEIETTEEILCHLRNQSLVN